MPGAEPERIRVGVVDDHALLVAGVRALLSAPQSPAQFVAGADTVLSLLRVQQPLDVVLLDVRLSDGSTCEENVRRLVAEGLTVLLHADRRHREAVPAGQRAGAHGVVWKNDPVRTLLDALVAVHRGERWNSVPDEDRVELTHRELEVLRLYVSGMKYAETAAALDPPVSLESVKTYLSRIRKRYHDAGRPASTRMELRQRALEDGLIPPEF
jgi:DNA-binding NarL/FixJ family response regulator